jgi:hypothetical protein
MGDVRLAMKFALGVYLDCCLPLDLMDAYLNLAEMSVLEGISCLFVPLFLLRCLFVCLF